MVAARRNAWITLRPSAREATCGDSPFGAASMSAKTATHARGGKGRGASGSTSPASVRTVAPADALAEPSDASGSPLKRRPVRRRSIAVTGANTFLGRNIVGLLEEDDAIARIVVIDVKNPSTCGAQDRVLRGRSHAAGGRIARRGDPQRRAGRHVRPPRVSRSPTHAAAWATSSRASARCTCSTRARARLRKLGRALDDARLRRASEEPELPRPSATRCAGTTGSPFVNDKIEAEHQVQQFARGPAATS